MTLILAGAVLLAACFIAGCGGGGGTSSSSNTGVEMVGQLVDGGILIGASAGGPGEMNIHYPNAYQVPSAYSIAVSKIELMKAADDPAPYVLFNTGGVTRARVITLSDGNVAIGSNSQYPEPGTYTHVRVTCAYQQMTILADVGDGNGYVAHTFRCYNSTVGSVQDGDVLMQINGVWNWIKGGSYYPLSGGRPDGVPGTLAAHSYLASEDSDDPNTFTIAFERPLVIPAAPVGKYPITAGFDLTASPEADNSTGIFIWDDVTQDGQFKPGVDMAQGGDGNAAEYEANGAPLWAPMGPTITFNGGTD